MYVGKGDSTYFEADQLTRSNAPEQPGLYSWEYHSLKYIRLPPRLALPQLGLQGVSFSLPQKISSHFSMR